MKSLSGLTRTTVPLDQSIQTLIKGPQRKLLKHLNLNLEDLEKELDLVSLVSLCKQYIRTVLDEYFDETLDEKRVSKWLDSQGYDQIKKTINRIEEGGLETDQVLLQAQLGSSKKLRRWNDEFQKIVAKKDFVHLDRAIKTKVAKRLARYGIPIPHWDDGQPSIVYPEFWSKTIPVDWAEEILPGAINTGDSLIVIGNTDELGVDIEHLGNINDVAGRLVVHQKPKKHMKLHVCFNEAGDYLIRGKKDPHRLKVVGAHRGANRYTLLPDSKVVHLDWSPKNPQFSMGTPTQLSLTAGDILNVAKDTPRNAVVTTNSSWQPLPKTADGVRLIEEGDDHASLIFVKDGKFYLQSPKYGDMRMVVDVQSNEVRNSVVWNLNNFPNPQRIGLVVPSSLHFVSSDMLPHSLYTADANWNPIKAVIDNKNAIMGLDEKYTITNPGKYYFICGVHPTVMRLEVDAVAPKKIADMAPGTTGDLTVYTSQPLVLQQKDGLAHNLVQTDKNYRPVAPVQEMAEKNLVQQLIFNTPGTYHFLDQVKGGKCRVNVLPSDIVDTQWNRKLHKLLPKVEKVEYDGQFLAHLINWLDREDLLTQVEDVYAKGKPFEKRTAICGHNCYADWQNLGEILRSEDHSMKKLKKIINECEMLREPLSDLVLEKLTNNPEVSGLVDLANFEKQYRLATDKTHLIQKLVNSISDVGQVDLNQLVQ